jgi:hypothetical protein
LRNTSSTSGAQEHRPGADGEIGRTRDHRIGRRDAHQDAVRDLQPLILVESGVLGDEGRAERQRRSRQRHQDLDVLSAARRGKKPNDEAEQRGGWMAEIEHRHLPDYVATTFP